MMSLLSDGTDSNTLQTLQTFRLRGPELLDHVSVLSRGAAPSLTDWCRHLVSRVPPGPPLAMNEVADERDVRT